MSTSVGVHSKIVNSTVAYLDTAYLTKCEPFNAARARLVRDLGDGTHVSRTALRDRDRYPASGYTVESLLGASGVVPGLRNDDERKLVARLFAPLAQSELYTHQVDALKAALVDERHVAITTGTGSGKTLAFLLPRRSASCERPSVTIDGLAGRSPIRGSTPRGGGEHHPPSSRDAPESRDSPASAPF